MLKVPNCLMSENINSHRWLNDIKPPNPGENPARCIDCFCKYYPDFLFNGWNHAGKSIWEIARENEELAMQCYEAWKKIFESWGVKYD